MVDYFREGWEQIRPQVKLEIQSLIDQVGVAGVLEIRSEIAESQAEQAPSPKFVAYWQTTAAATKQLSEELFWKGLQR